MELFIKNFNNIYQYNKTLPPDDSYYLFIHSRMMLVVENIMRPIHLIKCGAFTRFPLCIVEMYRGFCTISFVSQKAIRYGTVIVLCSVYRCGVGIHNSWYTFDGIPALCKGVCNPWKHLCQLQHNAVIGVWHWQLSMVWIFHDARHRQCLIVWYLYFGEENYIHYTAYDPFLYIYFSFPL